MRKLIKAWNDLPAGASVTLDPAEQVVLVDPDRLAHLEREGHLAPAPSREIPDEVRTGGGRRSPGRFQSPIEGPDIDPDEVK